MHPLAVSYMSQVGSESDNKEMANRGQLKETFSLSVISITQRSPCLLFLFLDKIFLSKDSEGILERDRMHSPGGQRLCVDICVHVCMYVHIHACVYVGSPLYMYICVYVCMFVCECVVEVEVRWGFRRKR